MVQQFERNGIKAAGEKGYFQTVPVHALRLRPDQSAIELTRNGRPQQLRWPQHMTVTPAFTQHPTVPKERLVADINLDQLPPIFH